MGARMKLRMHENSLFAILLRSPWWVSFLIAGGLFAGLRLVVAPLYASFFALPFAVIGAYALSESGSGSDALIPNRVRSSAHAVGRRSAVIRRRTRG